MAEYIERDVAIAALTEFWDDQTVDKYGTARKCLVARRAIERATKVLESLPAADVEPVRHGRWKLHKHYGDYECSVCGNGDVITPLFYTLKMKYCPNCGAKMEGDRRKP